MKDKKIGKASGFPCLTQVSISNTCNLPKMKKTVNKKGFI